MTRTFDKISVYRLYQKQKSIDVPRIYLEYATHKKERKEEYTTASKTRLHKMYSFFH